MWIGPEATLEKISLAALQATCHSWLIPLATFITHGMADLPAFGKLVECSDILSFQGQVNGWFLQIVEILPLFQKILIKCFIIDSKLRSCNSKLCFEGFHSCNSLLVVVLQKAACQKKLFSFRSYEWKETVY
jgi:hypothetical protein